MDDDGQEFDQFEVAFFLLTASFVARGHVPGSIHITARANVQYTNHDTHTHTHTHTHAGARAYGEADPERV